MTTKRIEFLLTVGKEWKRGTMHRIYINNIQSLVSITRHSNTEDASINGQSINRGEYLAATYTQHAMYYDVTKDVFVSGDSVPACLHNEVVKSLKQMEVDFFEVNTTGEVAVEEVKEKDGLVSKIAESYTQTKKVYEIFKVQTMHGFTVEQIKKHNQALTKLIDGARNNISFENFRKTCEYDNITAEYFGKYMQDDRWTIIKSAVQFFGYLLDLGFTYNETNGSWA